MRISRSRDMKRNKGTAADIFCIVGMIVAWTSYYLASDWAVEFTGSAFAAGMLLRVGALIFLTVYMLARGKFALIFKQGKTALVLLVIGVLGYMLDTFANLGFRYGSVGTGTVLLKTDILMANVVAALLFRERLYASDWVATAVMLGGVIMVLDIDFTSAGFNWYDLFFIASAASVTANAFVIKGAQDRLGADSDVIGYYNNFVVLVLFTVSALAAGDFRTLGELRFETWHVFALLGGGLGQTLIYVFYYRNLRRHAVWVVKLYLLFVPVLTCAAGVLFFDEAFGWLKAAGMVLVLGGAAAIALRGKINKGKIVRKDWEKEEYSRIAAKGENYETHTTG